MAQRLALIIGNSVFRDQTLARLLKPDADVGALADVLLDKEIGDFNDVKLLVNMSSTQVRRAISNFYSKKQRDDLLLLYFSGHGVLDDQGRLHLAVKDTERALLRATAIPAAFITEEMNNSRSRRQVLILDCCHSGAFARGSKGATGASVGTATAFEGTGFGRLVLTATDATQYAWEGDQVTGEAENSVFTHYLIQGLKTGQADSDGDGRITVDELYDYTYEQVVHRTPKQTPGKWSYREQGEIVIAHTPGFTLPEPQMTGDLSELDDEREDKIIQLYNKGLAAYYLDEWDKAARYFTAVLELQPEQQEVANKLEEARRQARFNKLYDQAQLALETEDWGKALTALDTLASEAPDFKDVASKLEYANKQKKLSDMYEEARQLYSAQEWQAVVNILSKIKTLDPDYPDPDNLLEKAKAEAAEIERQRELANLYNIALQEMDAGHWDESRQHFLQVLEMEPGYEDAESLLSRTEAEIQQAEVARQREGQIAALYLEARASFDAHKWEDVLEKLDEIRALEPDFFDPEDIGAKAKAEDEKERAEKTARQQVIKQAEGPKDNFYARLWRRKWLMVASAITVVLVLIIVFSLMQIPPFKQASSPETPADQSIAGQVSLDPEKTIMEGDVETTVVATITEVSIPIPTEMAMLQFWTSSDEEEMVGKYETIVAQWASSGHADETAMAFRRWDENDPPEVPDTCAKCHTSTGFIEYVGSDGSALGVIENSHPPAKGIECIACHNTATVVMDTAVFPSGAVITGLGPEAHCMQCHQGRTSKFQVDEIIEENGLTEDLDTVSEALSFRNIHYYAAAATLYGTEAMGGYEYEEKTYNGKYVHVTGYDTCLGCHDPHTLELKYEECADCHEGVTSNEDVRNIRMEGSEVDYDGDGDTEEGIAFEIEGLREMLYQAIQVYAGEIVGVPIIYADIYPYFFIDTNEDGEADIDESGSPVRYNAWTSRLLKATYNYQTVTKDPGAYMHGGKYINQLLYDSIEDLSSVLSTPVDLPTINRVITNDINLFGKEVVLR